MGERSTMPLLEVDNLGVTLQTQRGPAQAVRGVSFSLERGETLGLVGESGCGKSITAMALMGLLPDSARRQRQHPLRRRGAGRPAGARTMCRLRGNRIGMIFQEPMTALNPVHTIGHQVAEPLRLHSGILGGRGAQGSDRVARPRRHPRCRRGASTPIRTSSPAASASASPSRWRWPAGRTC